MVNIDKLRNHINKVWLDTYYSKNIRMGSPIQAYLIDGDTLFVYIKDARIKKTHKDAYNAILSTLEKTLPSEFGIELGEHSCFGQRLDKPSLLVTTKNVRVGYSVGTIMIDGVYYIVSISGNGSKSNKLPHGLNSKNSTDIIEAMMSIDNKMKSIGGKTVYPASNPNCWGDYLRDYESAFGEPPLTLNIEKIL